MALLLKPWIDNGPAWRGALQALRPDLEIRDWPELGDPADIDYALAEASTPYGIIGVKVWIFKGEIMEHDPSARDRRQQELQDGPAPRGAGGGRR